MTSKNKPVLLLAETGFIIRNLLLGYFADEVSKDRKLLVAVQNPGDTDLIALIKGKNIELVDFPFEPYADTRTGMKRLLSWDNIIYNTKLAVKDNESLRLQTILFEGRDALGKAGKVNAMLQKIGKTINTIGLSNTLEDTYLEKYVAHKSVAATWEALLKQYDPAVVVSSMLSHSVRYRCSTDLPVMTAARKMGIKTCTLIQSWDNLSSKTSVLPEWLDMYYTWSEVMTQELMQYNPRIKPEKIKIVGSPQYDYHLNKDLLESRESYVRRLGLDPGHPYILIGTGTPRWMPDEMQKTIGLCAAVNKHLPDMQCLIRLHPKDNNKRWQPYLEELKKHKAAIQYTSPETHMDEGGFVPPKDFYRDQVNAIYHSEVVINSSSSITVDAAILDKPVICIAYDLEKDILFPEGRALTYSRSAHYSKLTQTGGVRLVDSEADCVAAIQAYSSNPTLHRAERVKIVETVTADVREKAGIKLAQEVKKLAGAI